MRTILGSIQLIRKYIVKAGVSLYYLSDDTEIYLLLWCIIYFIHGVTTQNRPYCLLFVLITTYSKFCRNV